MKEKIQKILAAKGVASRRAIEEMIKLGKISINGKPAKLGERIDLDASVRIDGKEVHLSNQISVKTRVILYHKPEGEICSRHDPEDRPSVFANLPRLRESRWVSVGRLDFNTSGILIFTNNGELANKLMHPSSNIEREYSVRVQGSLTQQNLNILKKGVKLEDGMAFFKTLTDQGGTGSNHWYNVTVGLGKNRIVRRLFESQDVRVSRLIRIRFGGLTLPSVLKRGKWMELTPDQQKTITQPFKNKLIVKPRQINKRPATRKATQNKTAENKPIETSTLTENNKRKLPTLRLKKRHKDEQNKR